MRGMESHENSVRKRRNREHHNSRNGCLQCKARKVKVRVAFPAPYPSIINLAHPLFCDSATKTNPSAEAVLAGLHPVHMQITLA